MLLPVKQSYDRPIKNRSAALKTELNIAFIPPAKKKAELQGIAAPMANRINDVVIAVASS